MIASWLLCTKRCERGPARGFLALVAALMLTACSGSQKIERRAGAHVESGRKVPSSAYAWYARARALHRQGELELAEHAYQKVLALDARSGAAYAGLGAAHCATSRERARGTFARGLRRADEKVPIHLAQGRCELRWGEAERALEAARRAFARAPAAPEVSALLVDALRSASQGAEAARVERAYLLYARSQPPRVAPAPDRRAVDRALERGNLVLAEALSLEAMSQGELALRALALGHVAFARELAQLIVLAAPTDGTAHLVLALAGEDAGVPLGDLSPPHPLGLCLLAERLRSHVGADAAAAYLEVAAPAARAPWQNAEDPLLAECARRLPNSRPASAETATSAAPQAP